ncbi:tRNA (adenosine(37)-N6)-threonylcarbamoyltransferase complex ATPase subunit type 1 TsaE [Hyphococcus sp. DH-69]|uniref:tRNA (adenosine(37)-N6)-threonylcarbamoyltransferase complex ATPase subunit type 1 TsaE n=1 Tax=Hyphococcus formosus TaxID=3143534 RepID=UPI00398B0D5F
MTTFEIELPDEAATSALGAKMAPMLRDGDILRLSGDLGAGKTTFARAIIAALTDTKDAPSPTYMLVETYDADRFQLWHFDLYRLDDPRDVWELGLEEALDDGVVLVEWPDRIDGLLPENSLGLRIETAANGKARRVTLHADAAWATRLKEAGIV